MRKTFRSASILTVMLLLVPVARAAEEELPNINNRGDDEKKFVAKLAETVVPAARTSIKSSGVTVKKFEKKDPKEGRTNFVITAGYKGAVSKKDYTATITIHFDTSDPKKWEVLRIEYKDDSKNILAGPNVKNVNALVDKLNKAGKVK